MLAIIETGGKQYQVSPSQIVQIEKLKSEEGKEIIFDKVLLVADGGDVKVGNPYVTGAKVSGNIIEQGRSAKLRVFKYKSKSRYRRTQGHRQYFTAVKIEKIQV